MYLQERSFVHAHDVSRMRVSLNYCTIFDNDYKAVSHGIPAEFQWNSNGIPWIPFMGFHWESFPEAPGFRPFPLEFFGKKWEFPWKWKPKWLRLQPNAFHRNSMEFRGILTFHWESGGIRRNSWRRVKTSSTYGHPLLFVFVLHYALRKHCTYTSCSTRGNIIFF